MVQNPIILYDNARSHTAAAAAMDLLRRWQWEILEHPPYPPDESIRLQSLHQRDRTLRGTRYITRDELIHGIGRSIWNINKYGRVDGVRRLPNIWQNVINRVEMFIQRNVRFFQHLL